MITDPLRHELQSRQRGRLFRYSPCNWADVTSQLRLGHGRVMNDLVGAEWYWTYYYEANCRDGRRSARLDGLAWLFLNGSQASQRPFPGSLGRRLWCQSCVDWCAPNEHAGHLLLRGRNERAQRRQL